MQYFLEIVFTVLLFTSFAGAQRQGDLCVIAGTMQPGVCRHISKCSVAFEAAFHGLSPQVCASLESGLIVCCPWVPGQLTGLDARCQANITIPREGDNCTMVDTRRAGVCSQFGNCQPAMEAASKGISPQVCASLESGLIVCCPWVPGQLTGLEARCQANITIAREGDNCTMVDTGRAGVCSQFGNCQPAIEAASKGISPQICTVESTVQIVCCPRMTVVEGDQCSVVATGRTGKCLRISRCPAAVEAALKGTIPQICTLDGSVPIVCCEGIVEGSHCTLKNTGIAGTCRPFANCQTAKEAAYKDILPQRCDLTDNESELVCCTEAECPPLPKGLVTQLPIGSKAADYCIELAEKIHPCQETRSGWTRGDMCSLLTPDSNTVYHETPMTTTAEAPYLGLIGSGQRGNITWQWRSVSLVSEQWVLCSAWVIVNISSNKVFVGLGGIFTPQYNPDEIYGVTRQYKHPQYSRIHITVYNDIALLRLDREVTFTSRILPACLHTGTSLPDSGFVLTGPEYRTRIHYKTTMQKVSQEECSKVFPAGSYYHPAGVKHDQEICSRPVNTTGGCPDCYFGSPLTLPNSHRVACTHLLVGLACWHHTLPCTYTNARVSSYIPWIEGIVWPEGGIVV